MLNDLAIVHQDAREFPQAERRFSKPSASSPKHKARTIPTFASYVQNLAALSSQEGNYRAAEPLLSPQLRNQQHSALTGILERRAEFNKLAEISNLAEPSPALLSFQERAAQASPRSARSTTNLKPSRAAKAGC